MQFLWFEQKNNKELIVKDENIRNIFISFDNQLITLRGGGCGSTKAEEPKSTCFPDLPNDLAIKLKEYTNTLVEKAQFLMDENQKEEIMIAIQWFYFNQQHFNTLCFKFYETQRIYQLLIVCLDSLLKTAYIYLKNSGFLCIYILQICNDLSRVIFSFLTRDDRNKKKQLEDSYKQQLQQYIASFEDLLKNEEANIWVTGIEYELTMIRTAIEHTPSNSKAQEDLFGSFMKGVISSICNLSPQEELLQALFDIGKQLITELYNKYYKNVLRRYKIYYFFETLKWAVVNQLRLQFSVKNILNSLIEGYNQYIKDSTDWQIHFCWIKMISDLATYRPIISKQENFKTDQQLNQWNQMIINKQIILLSYSKQHARILFKDDLKTNFEITQKNLSFVGQNSFKLFFKQLLGQETLDRDKVRLWQDYFKFSFKNLAKKLKEEISLNELLFGSREIEIFEAQNIYLEEMIVQSTALEQQIQKQFQNFSNEKIKTENISEIYSDDIGSSLKQLKEKLIQILQLVFLIRFTIVQFVKKCKLILYDQVINNKQQSQIQTHNNLLEIQLNLLVQKQTNYNTQIQNFIDLYPQFINSLSYLELQNEQIERFCSEEEKIVYLKQFKKINYYEQFQSLKKASKIFLDQVLQIQQNNLNNFHQKINKHAEQFSQIQIESLIKTITYDFVQQFPLMIKDLIKLLNFENQNFQTRLKTQLNSDQFILDCRIFINCCQILPQILIIFQHQVKKITDSLKILLNNQQISIDAQKSLCQNKNKFEEILDIIRKQREDLSYFFKSNSEEIELDIMKFINRINKDLATIKLKQKQFQKFKILAILKVSLIRQTVC